ncbi:hypothetical protein AB0M47_18770 [Hamadaea sp. NPDC051192]|uniref:hypothetical protein n=1 Tax=Hamadaea sp. NPDC051192 TaxID=3154940 RepID=UPI0034245A27
MTRVAVSGHRGLPEATERLVNQALRETLGQHGPDLVGISCIADGADQLFAHAVLELGGRLEVVVPATKYRQALPSECWPTYDRLLSEASQVHQLEYTESTSEAHQAASEYMVDRADILVAIWDGLPARAYGGTADVVAYARDMGKTVEVIWPAGASRG